jgi:hypothetical protein
MARERKGEHLETWLIEARSSHREALEESAAIFSARCRF